MWAMVAEASEQMFRRDRAEDPAEREAMLESLAQRGITLRAQRRLDDLRNHPSFFTSDLTVNEFLLAHHRGLQPRTQVMGSSVDTRGIIYVGDRGKDRVQELMAP